MIKKRIKWAHPLQGRRIKEAIADALDVDESQIWQNNSVWENRVGGCTWGVSNCPLARQIGPMDYRRRYDLHSFCTMKDCLKFGFTIDHDDNSITQNTPLSTCTQCLKEKNIMDMSYERREDGLCKECAGEPKGEDSEEY